MLPSKLIRPEVMTYGGGSSAKKKKKEEEEKVVLPFYEGENGNRAYGIAALANGVPIEVVQSTPEKISATPKTETGTDSAFAKKTEVDVTPEDTGSISGVPQNIYNKLSAPFQESQAYKDAMAYTDSLLQKLSSGRTKYTDELDNLVAEYKNRGSFSYDPNSDMLYQNYLAAMQNAGQLAMKDTMGQAAALTGGYGSSYATAAANSAYNNYLQSANDNLANFYNMALDRYRLEGDQALENIDLARLQDDIEYRRLADEYSRNLARANDQYNRDYTAWSSAVQQANDIADAMRGDYWKSEEMAAEKDYRDWQRTQAESAGQNGQDAMTETQMNALFKDALDVYINAGGGEKGEAALDAYLDSKVGFNLSKATSDSVYDYVLDHTGAYKMTSDKGWGPFFQRANDKFVDIESNVEYSYRDLEKMHDKGIIRDDVWEQIKNLKEGQTTNIFIR